MNTSKENYFYAIVKNIENHHICFVNNEPSAINEAEIRGYQVIDFAPNISEAQRKIFGRPFTH